MDKKKIGRAVLQKHTKTIISGSPLTNQDSMESCGSNEFQIPWLSTIAFAGLPVVDT